MWRGRNQTEKGCPQLDSLSLSSFTLSLLPSLSPSLYIPWYLATMLCPVAAESDELGNELSDNSTPEGDASLSPRTMRNTKKMVTIPCGHL